MRQNENVNSSDNRRLHASSALSEIWSCNRNRMVRTHSQKIKAMEINMKSTVLFFAIVTAALSAGLFYAWTISVVPGLKNIPTKSYLEAMQSMNRAILNPGFFVIFFWLSNSDDTEHLFSIQG